MHYVTDTSGIRDAKEKITEAKENKVIAGIEKEITAIEATIDAIDRQIDALNKQSEAIDEQAAATSDYYDTLMEESDSYYDQLIDDTESYWDSLINGLEEYQTRWEELADIEEEAKMNAALKELGITTEEILNMSEEEFENFKKRYLAILTEIYAGNEEVQNALQEASGISIESLQPLIAALRETASETDNYSDSAETAKRGSSELSTELDELRAELDSVKAELDNVRAELERVKAGADGAANGIDGMSDAMNDVPSSEKFEGIADVFSKISGVANAVCESVKKATAELQNFQKAKDAVSTGIDKVVNAAGTKTGKAYAAGTKISGTDHYEKNALRSEYGQPELTLYPDGTTELTTSPVMSDLPTGTVVYNEEQTKDIINNKPARVGKAYAAGTEDGVWIGADGHRYRDIKPGDRAWELQKAFEPLLNKWLSDEEKIISNAVFAGQKQMEKWTKEITNNTAISNVVNNRNIQPMMNNNINITCPGVTSQEVARQVGVELEKQLGGLYLDAMQQSMIK